MSTAQRVCWIGAGLRNLLDGRIQKITETGANIELLTPVAVPEECNLYFTTDCQVGRKCKVISQTGSVVRLSFQGRIEPMSDRDGDRPNNEPSSRSNTVPRTSKLCPDHAAVHDRHKSAIGD